MKKEWKDIVDYEGLYQISNYGDVYSLRRNMMMKTPVSNSGYKHLTIRKDNIRRSVPVHTLVLETFIGKRPKNKVCNHIDENKTNNRVDNLEWVTYSQNSKYSYYPGSKTYQNITNAVESNTQPVIEIHSNRWFPSQKVAQLTLGLHKSWIKNQLCGTSHKNHFYQFKRADKEDNMKNIDQIIFTRDELETFLKQFVVRWAALEYNQREFQNLLSQLIKVEEEKK